MSSLVALVIHLSLRFDPSIHSKIVRRQAAAEVRAIWRDFGVELAIDDAPDAALCLEATVLRTAPVTRRDEPSVLGQTFAGDGIAAVPPPIRIGFDRVDSLAQPTPEANAMLHEYAVGNGIGLVLAHEIGHILLGAHHDARGLMQRNFSSSDLGRPERWLFRLEENSLTRLRARVATLAFRTARGCAAEP